MFVLEFFFIFHFDKHPPVVATASSHRCASPSSPVVAPFSTVVAPLCSTVVASRRTFVATAPSHRCRYITVVAGRHCGTIVSPFRTTATTPSQQNKTIIHFGILNNCVSESIPPFSAKEMVVQAKLSPGWYSSRLRNPATKHRNGNKATFVLKSLGKIRGSVTRWSRNAPCTVQNRRFLSVL